MQNSVRKIHLKASENAGKWIITQNSVRKMYVKASENHGKVANYVKGCAKNQSKIIYKLWTE